MVKLYDVKITVLRRMKPSEIFDEMPVTTVNPPEACPMLREGQEFIVEDLKMPEGFCTTAWHTIWCNIRTLSFGANLPWYKEKGVALNSCYEGLRPVIFKLERVE